MIKATCIGKNYSRNGIIESYVLKSYEGETVTVPENKLRQSMKSGRIVVDNLKLTSTFIIVNKDINEKNSNIPELKEISKDDKDKANTKMVMLGVNPEVDNEGYVISANNKINLFSDQNSGFIKNITELDKTAKFIGDTELYCPYGNYGVKLKFGKVITSNIKVLNSIGRKNQFNVTLISPDILIKSDKIDLNIVNEIYKIFKDQYNVADVSAYGEECSRVNMFKIVVDFSKNPSISYNQVYNTTKKYVDNFKLSRYSYRRLYDIMALQELIYSMYLSTGASDKRYKELFKTIDKYVSDSIAYSSLRNCTWEQGFSIVITANIIYDKYYPQIIKQLS